MNSLTIFIELAQSGLIGLSLFFIQYLQGQKLNTKTIEKSLTLNNDVCCNINGIDYKKNDSIKLDSILKKIKNRFSDNYNIYSQHILANAKNPVLIMNGNTVHHSEVKAKIDILRIEEILYIDYKEEPQSLEIYGQNAKNGLVSLWTKEGSKRNK
jgi:hypothetical protein